MRHVSLGESFWRCATEALVSGESIHAVEPPLLDVSRLLQRIHEFATHAPGGRLGLLTLDGAEEERALGLAISVLLSRGGLRVLLADLDFADDTWSRLLGEDEELDGVVDHVAYGISPARLVRRSSAPGLSFLPSGGAALDPAGLVRSHKVRSCLEAVAHDHDLVCVGLPFDATLRWGEGATAGLDRVIVLGRTGEELAFELAIPRLVRQVELVATVDVAPLGRWRPAIGAALPSLVGGTVGSVRGEARPGRRDERTAQGLGRWAAAAEAATPASAASAAVAELEEPPPRPEPPERGSPPGDGPAPPHLRHETHGLVDPASAHHSNDAEAAADMAFLSGFEGREAPAAPPALDASPPPPAPERAQPSRAAIHPKLRAVQEQLELAASPVTPAPDLRELAGGWRDAVDVEQGEPTTVAQEEESEGWWGAIPVAVVLCLALGAGAFWYWRANQQIPEGQFTFVESAESVYGEIPEAAAPGARIAAPAAGFAAPAAESAAPATKITVPAVETAASREPDAAQAAPGASQVPPQGSAEDAPERGSSSSSAAERGSATGPVDDPAVGAVGGSAAADAGVPAAGSAAGGDEGGGEAEARAGAFEEPREGPLLGWSLHVGSYASDEAARRAAFTLRARGVTAFVAPVLLEGKGEWHRVFVEALPDGPASRARLARVKSEGLVPEGTARETPWALYLGTFPTPEAAAPPLATLERSGITGYLVGPGPVHLYAGAFESAADAEILNRRLRDRGFEAALVRRRGAEVP